MGWAGSGRGACLRRLGKSAAAAAAGRSSSRSPRAAAARRFRENRDRSSAARQLGQAHQRREREESGPVSEACIYGAMSRVIWLGAGAKSNWSGTDPLQLA